MRNQTFQDFEWIVADDASTDDTLDLLERWQREARFDLRIRSFPRRVGKPVADNDAARAARGTYFVELGSDDAYVRDGLEKLVAAWQGIPEDQVDRYASVTARSITDTGAPLGPPFPSSPYDIPSLDLWRSQRYAIDGCFMTRTAIARRFPYPEVDYIVPEGVVWQHGIGRSLLTRCIDDVVLIMSRSAGNRISGSGKMRFNRGYAYGLAQVLNSRDAGIWRTPLAAARTVLNYGRLSHHGQVPFGEALGLLRSSGTRLATAAAYPLARLVAARDQMKRKVEHVPFEPFRGQPKAIEPPRQRFPD